jgi:hypothetical protein
MEEATIKQLWHDYDLKLEKTLQLNYKIIRDMQTQKAEDRISSFRRVYLFKTLTYKNIHRNWVRKFIESFGGKKLSTAMEFLNDIEEYQKINLRNS